MDFWPRGTSANAPATPAAARSSPSFLIVLLPISTDSSSDGERYRLILTSLFLVCTLTLNFYIDAPTHHMENLFSPEFAFDNGRPVVACVRPMSPERHNILFPIPATGRPRCGYDV